MEAGRQNPTRSGRCGICSSSTTLAEGEPMTRYEVVIYWSAEDQLFIAEVPELPGCIAHGDSRAEALGNAEDAIDLWMEVAKRRGRPIPEPKGRRLMVA